jgi:cell division ATPase FtsA
MGAEKDIIVAVELGSTAIRAIAGKKEPDGTMRILAVAQEESTIP